MPRLMVDIAKNTALVLPPMRRVLDSRQRAKGHGFGAHDPEHPRSVYATLRGKIEPHREISGDLLEIGPGDSLGTAALFVKHGVASATCLDTADWESVDRDFYAELGVDDVLDRIQYVHPARIEAAPFPGESFDLIISWTCFEHFHDPAAAIAEHARLLRPGGVGAHLIDMRDHRSFDEQPLDFLRFPDWVWQLAAARRPSYTNRWRASDFIAEFERAGLTVCAAEPSRTTDVDEALAARLDRRFRCKQLDDLATTGLFLVVKKPAH